MQWRGTHHRYSLDKLLGRDLTSKTEAQQAADELRIAIREGRFKGPGDAIEPPSALTVSDLLDRYRERVLTAKSASAVEAQLSAQRVISRKPIPTARGALLPFGRWPVDSVTADALEQFRDARKPYGTTGANRILEHLRAAFTWGASKRRALVADNPFRDGERAAVRRFPEHARTRRLHSGEAERLLAAAGPHLRAIIECALETGMRRGEILSLQWSQVRLDGRPHIFLPAWKTKTRRDRVIPISARLRAVLDMLQTDAAGQQHGPDAYVFGHQATGQRINDFKTAWNRAVLTAHGYVPAFSTRANLDADSRRRMAEINLHFHDLRREAGSRWLDGGIPLHQVQVWLGHAAANQTAIYLKVPEGDGHAAMARFDALRAENLQETCKLEGEFGSSGWIRTSNPPVNSRMLYR